MCSKAPLGTTKCTSSDLLILGVMLTDRQEIKIPGNIGNVDTSRNVVRERGVFISVIHNAIWFKCCCFCESYRQICIRMKYLVHNLSGGREKCANSLEFNRV